MPLLDVASLRLGGLAVDDVRLGATSLVSGFNPLDYGSPLVAFWAEDPDQSKTDGAAVSSWRNAGSLGGSFSQATAGKRPVYRAGVLSKPTVEFAAASSQTLGLTGLATQSTPYTLVLVVTADDAGDYKHLAVNTAAFSSAVLLGTGGATTALTNADASITASGGTIGVDEFAVIVARWPDSGTGSLRVTDVEVDTFTAVTETFEQAWLGSAADLANYVDGHIAFAGVYPEATEPADLVTGLISHYST